MDSGRSLLCLEDKRQVSEVFVGGDQVDASRDETSMNHEQARDDLEHASSAESVTQLRFGRHDRWRSITENLAYRQGFSGVAGQRFRSRAR